MRYFPFSFNEYLGITEKEPVKQSYIDYMESGALPELFMFPNDETKWNYISAIKDTVSNYIGYIEDTSLVHPGGTI